MRFDLFHSIGRIDQATPTGVSRSMTDQKVFANFFQQVVEADAMGFGTIWVAESHFSSELQKSGPSPVIPNYHGEVGLNCDSLQLAQTIFARTKRIGFGTAILNIVGGNGGPIAAADRVRSLAWLNSISPSPRSLDIGFASGRFPYINQPFGIYPRNHEEKVLWPQVQAYIFVEALEIFLRLSRGEAIGSEDLATHMISRKDYRSDDLWTEVLQKLEGPASAGVAYQKRWTFDRIKLVPEMDETELANLRFILGSSDPRAREHALKFADIDIFNLSFTPPEELNRIHAEMNARYAALNRHWTRTRLPRTVLIFLDRDAKKARKMAENCFDVYIEAMRGTAQVPDKSVLMARALIGDPSEVVEQLRPGGERGFHNEDRLMLWFEFNQSNGQSVLDGMRLFADEVMPHFSNS